MEKEERLITFNEIKSSLMFYCNELMLTPPGENTFLLYQYGPYIVANKVEWFHKKLHYIRNNDLKLMIYVRRLIDACGTMNFTIKEAKNNIVSVLYSMSKETSFPEIYMKKVHEIGVGLLEIIQKNQKETQSMESAMLNYSPIVQYQGGFLRPAEFTEKYTSIVQEVEPDFSELDELIHEYFFDDILHIMKNPEAFVNIDHNCFLGARMSWLTLPMDIVNIHHEMSVIHEKDFKGRSTPEFFAKMYFVLVYLRYVVKLSGWKDFFDDLFKINNLYNKISNGERINIPFAMEALSKVSPYNP